MRAVPGIFEAEIQIEGDKVVIRNLTITDADLANYLLSHDSSEQTSLLVDLIETAMQIQKMANSSSDVKELNSVAKQVRETMQSAGDEAFNDLHKLIQSQARDDEPGSLISLLKTKLVNQMISELDPAKETSPFYKISNQMARVLNEKLAADAEKAAGKKGTQHGRDFNKSLDGILQLLANRSGDSAEYTNDVASETGSKVGDEVITIDSAFTNGNPAKVVWEFKAVQKVTQQSALSELTEAMINRKAQAGVFVLARTQHNEDWASFSSHAGRRAIIIVDEDEIDELVVQYAHLWSRVEAVRSFGSTETEIDFEALKVKLEEASNALQGFKEIKSAHTSIQKGLQVAMSKTTESENLIKEKFDEILEIAAPN